MIHCLLLPGSPTMSKRRYRGGNPRNPGSRGRWIKVLPCKRLIIEAVNTQVNAVTPVTPEIGYGRPTHLHPSPQRVLIGKIIISLQVLLKGDTQLPALSRLDNRWSWEMPVQSRQPRARTIRTFERNLLEKRRQSKRWQFFMK
jgi:hypothetical protein